MSLTNQQIKDLRTTIACGGTVAPDGTPLNSELLASVCTAALNARKRGRRYRAMMPANADIVRADLINDAQPVATPSPGTGDEE